MRIAEYDFPLLIVDNFFTDVELKRNMNELHHLTLFMKNPDETGSAKDKDGNLKKKNKACWIHEIYGPTQRSSFIYNSYRKIFSPEFIEEVRQKTWFGNYIPMTNTDATLISLYENGDSYASHVDDATITTLVWLWNEPKAFTGGDMIFDDKYHFPIQNNMMVMFPSCIRHEVTEVLMEDKPGFGRYAITNFSSIV